MSTINFTENVSLNDLADDQLFVLNAQGVELFGTANGDFRVHWPATMIFQKNRYYDFDAHREMLAVSIYLVSHDNREKDNEKWQETLENEWHEDVRALHFRVCPNYSSFFRFLLKSDKIATSQSKIFKVAKNLHILPGKMFIHE